MRCENLFQDCLVCELTLNGKVSPLNRMLSYYWRQMVEVQFSQISSFSLSHLRSDRRRMKGSPCKPRWLQIHNLLHTAPLVLG